MNKGLLCLIAVCFSACSSKSVEERAVETFEGMGAIIEKNAGDCNAMGEQLSADVQSHQADLDALKALGERQGESFDAEKWQKQYGNRMAAAGQKMRKINACAGAPKVLEAMKPFTDYAKAEQEARIEAQRKRFKHPHDHGHHHGEMEAPKPEVVAPPAAPEAPKPEVVAPPAAPVAPKPEVAAPTAAPEAPKPGIAAPENP